MPDNKNFSSEDNLNTDYRNMLVTQECESSHLLDSSIMLVSTGALVVSIAFFKDFIGPIWLIKTSWIFLILSISLQLLSFWASENAFKLQTELYDKGLIYKQENKWSKWTYWLNCIFRTSFVIGFALLVIYGFLTTK